jgi:hypothetical protein
MRWPSQIYEEQTRFQQSRAMKDRGSHPTGRCERSSVEDSVAPYSELF